MHKYSISMQKSEPVKFGKLSPRLIVDTFTCMHDKGAFFRCIGICPPEIAPQSQRMCPAIFLQHLNREIISLQLRPKNIMVADRCDSAKKIPYTTPSEADVFLHRPMLCNDVRKFAVYVFAPIDVISIRRVGQLGEESKLQVVVRIDKARHDQIAREVDAGKS
jgi:hypothetical protein